MNAEAPAHPQRASMTTCLLQPAQPLAADDAALSRVLRQAGVTKQSNVRVTGPSGLTTVLWLYRHGYEQAAYVHANWVSSTRTADALLIPHPCGSEELAGLLQHGDCLRDGGVLIVQTPAELTDFELDQIAARLESLGYQLEHRVFEKGRAVFIARRSGLGGFRKAA